MRLEALSTECVAGWTCDRVVDDVETNLALQ